MFYIIAVFSGNVCRAPVDREICTKIAGEKKSFFSLFSSYCVPSIVFSHYFLFAVHLAESVLTCFAQKMVLVVDLFSS